MKNNVKIASKVNKSILVWFKEETKLVIAIDGYTGVGKTTLLNNLAKLNPEILAVNRDDFQIPKVKFNKLYKNKNPQERIDLFESEMSSIGKLERVIEAFRKSTGLYKIKAYDGVSGKVIIPRVYDFSKRIMVVEGVFMFHPKLLNHLWDKRIYLKGNIQKIDERRIKREKKRWGKDYFPEINPNSYFRQVIIALKRYMRQYKPEKSADLIIYMD